MKNKILLTGFLLAILFSVNSYSQSIDDVLSKYTDAIGGRSNWDAVKSLKFTGYMNIMNMDIPYTQYVKRPGLWLLEIQVQGMKIVQAYDGKSGWMINPMMGSKKPEKTEDEMTKTYKANSLIGGKLLNIKEMGYTAELIGTENVDGKEVYNIKLTDKDGEFTNYYIETATNLIYKTTAKLMRKGTEISTESVYSNYTKVNDVMIAFINDQKLTGAQNSSEMITVDKVEVNVNIDDKIFVMPAE
jgi:hypothetical protein